MLTVRIHDYTCIFIHDYKNSKSNNYNNDDSDDDNSSIIYNPAIRKIKSNLKLTINY